MDQKDFYNQLKNAFLLGNYHKVFEFLKTYSLEEQHLLYKDEICSLIVRSFLALEDRQTPEMETLIESNTDIKTVHDILYPFLHVLLYVKISEIYLNL